MQISRSNACMNIPAFDVPCCNQYSFNLVGGEYVITIEVDNCQWGYAGLYVCPVSWGHKFAAQALMGRG